ncbi:MAG: IS256 family transposase [Saprospiraceae bacterium]
MTHKPVITDEILQQKLGSLKTMSDVTDFAKGLIAPTLQAMLEQEMTQHLGYPRHDTSGNLTGNSRNGSSHKQLKTGFGETSLTIPRDRNGSFDPMAVRKYETVTSDVEEKIISMYAKGMSTRDINTHMSDIYGVSISADMVSSITDKVLPLVKQWQERPLSRLYPIVYLDGIHFKVRDGGKIVSRCAYIVLGINAEGMKEILGIWIGENEGSKFWLQVLHNIKHRGTEEMLICCVDGLSGFPNAIKTIYPNAQIQRCIIHQIRNTVKYIPHKHKKSFCKALKTIYTAVDEESGLLALEEVKEQFPEYKIYLKSWEDNWQELSPFFEYPDEMRRIIYTTNTIESLNRQFRKITKTKSVFPHNESLSKLLYLVQEDITKKWIMPIRDWAKIIAQLSIFFPDQIESVISSSSS